MKKREIVILAFLAGILSSCIGTKDIKYLQPNENLQINSEGLVPYNVPTYRVTKNDILSLNIITTPKGDFLFNKRIMITLRVSIVGSISIANAITGADCK